MLFTPGQPVLWLWTPGGGNSHRLAAKEPRKAVVTKVGPRRVQIRVADRGDTRTWVNIESLIPRTEG